MSEVKGYLIAAGAVSVVSALTLYNASENGSLPFIHRLNKAKEGQIRIACAGDSITYGYGVRRWSKNNYPAVLGRLLGTGFCVNNYGLSGSTAQPTADSPYTAARICRKSLLFQPDIVILMLGTNDSKPQNWKGRDRFLQAFRDLIRSYRELPTKPAVYIAAPPPAFGDPVKYGIDSVVLADEIHPALGTLAEEYDLPFIDMMQLFAGRSDLYCDGVHPNAAGARLIAETVFQSIQTNGRKKP